MFATTTYRSFDYWSNSNSTSSFSSRFSQPIARQEDTSNLCTVCLFFPTAIKRLKGIYTLFKHKKGFAAKSAKPFFIELMAGRVGLEPTVPVKGYLVSSSVRRYFPCTSESLLILYFQWFRPFQTQASHGKYHCGPTVRQHVFVSFITNCVVIAYQTLYARLCLLYACADTKF